MKSFVSACNTPSGSHHINDKVTVNIILEKGIKMKADSEPSLIYSNDIMTGKSNIKIPISNIESKTQDEISTIDITFSMETFDLSDQVFLKRSLENFGRFVFKYSLEDGTQTSQSIVVMFHKENDEVVYTFVSM